jgi:signal transduction histidine kinase
VNETVNLLKTQAAIKKVKLHVNSDVKHEVCSFDMMRTQQILINLLTNAIKFSHSGGMVLISLMSLKAGQNQMEVKIIIKD